MKVAITKNSKHVITLDKMPAVRRIIEECRKDEMKPEDYVGIVARYISGTNCIKVLEASAEIALNRRAWNDITEYSEDLDIWITFTAFCEPYPDDMFIKCGVYLSDIWKLTSDNADAMMKNMYIRKFIEKR